MDTVLLLIITGLGSSLVTTSLGIIIYSRIAIKPKVQQAETIATLKATNHTATVNEALEAYKSSPDFDSVKKEAFLMGKEEGRRDELAKFTVKVSPWKDSDKRFFKSVIKVGYTMQMFYGGIPLGDQMLRIEGTAAEVDKELVMQLIEKVEHRAMEIAKVFMTQGMSVVSDGFQNALSRN
jgi:hypothetical protein